MSYRKLRPARSHAAIQMYVYTTANTTGMEPGSRSSPVAFGAKLAGIHPGDADAPLAAIDFSKDLPYSGTTPAVISQAFDSDYYRYLHKRMVPLVLVLAVSSLFVLLFFPRLFKASLIKPLYALYGGMQRADGGDLDTKVKPQSNDEIGFLTRSFNRMLRSIKKAEKNFQALAENAQDGILIISEPEHPCMPTGGPASCAA